MGEVASVPGEGIVREPGVPRVAVSFTGLVPEVQMPAVPCCRWVGATGGQGLVCSLELQGDPPTRLPLGAPTFFS